MCARSSCLRWIAALSVPLLGTPVLCAQELLLAGQVAGGDLVVHGNVVQDQDTMPVVQAVWRGINGGNAMFQLVHTAEAGPDVGLMLDRLLESAIGTYLDARLHFARNGVTADLPAARMAEDLDGMVKAAAANLGFADLFEAFSQPTREQLDRVSRIDWSQAEFGVNGGDEQDKYLAIYYYVRSQREELERQIRADLLPLALVAVIGGSPASPGTTLQVNSTCGTVFDEQNFLCALDLQLADTGNGGLDPGLGMEIMRTMVEASEPEEVPEATVAPAMEGMRVRKRDQWLKSELDLINERIDRMDQRKELWELRDRMDDIESRLTDLSLEVQDVRADAKAAPGNPLAELSDLTGRNITVRFGRNSVSLDPEYQVLLNEVFEQLARSPEERVLITGYTDRSGDPGVNLSLSEQRAKVVRNYLLQRGIAAERLLLNYYGDSRSLARDPNERRVEVEWLH
jgi:outer membrane protein OmpA-like peptidoglycan-associated protein